ncbi:hypothetical protein FRC03_007384 [Tulasnella sp. 419]|nr:hypothetical protein FRC03_007384 [Tulasnella sp. 419]
MDIIAQSSLLIADKSDQSQNGLESCDQEIATFSPTLPLEVLFHILTFLQDKSLLLAAARVSSTFQRECEHILYRDICVFSFWRFDRFLSALEKRSWRPAAVRSLVVTPRHSWKYEYTSPLPSVISLMTNLRTLKLKGQFMPSAFEGLRLPSSLKSLSIRPWVWIPLTRLLNELTSLRYLDCIGREDITTVSSTSFLPNLTRIKSDTRSIIHLVPNRPVTGVSMIEGLEEHEQASMFRALKQSSCAIEHFTGYFLATSIQAGLKMILHELPQLQTLEVKIDDHSMDTTEAVDWKSIPICGNRLRSLKLSVDEDSELFSRSPMDPSCLGEWKGQSPLLNLVTVDQSSWNYGPSGWILSSIPRSRSRA